MYSSLPEFFWRESACIQYTLSVKLAVFHTSVILDCAGQRRGGALQSIINVLKKSEMQKTLIDASHPRQDDQAKDTGTRSVISNLAKRYQR